MAQTESNTRKASFQDPFESQEINKNQKMRDAKADLFKNRRSQQIEKLDIRNANYKKCEKTEMRTSKKSMQKSREVDAII